MNATHRIHRPGFDGQRRGVLLLVVLSMLTLFMMLGAAYLVVATRSRETAKSFARLSLRSDNVRLPHSQVLDTVMLRVLRGNTSPTGARTLPLDMAAPRPTGVAIVPLESILADKYGYETLQGDAYTVAGEGGGLAVYEQSPLLTIPSLAITSTLPSPFEACDLNGRIITILGPGREPSSHRILRTTQNADRTYRLQLDNQPRNRPYQPVPAGIACKVVINGREFAGDGTRTSPNEAWDGFDDQNPFLAHVAPSDGSPDHAPSLRSISSSVVKKVGYVQTGTAQAVLDQLGLTDASGFAYGADNDNDGKPDGFYLDFGLPTVIAPNGDQVLLQASVLIVDLDGRINVNAHGTLSQSIYPAGPSTGTHTLWPSGAGIPAAGGVFSSLPLGSGYGPPEINIDRLFLDDNVLYPSKYRSSGQPLAAANGRPIENPAAYLRTGVTYTRISDSTDGGRYGVGSRFFSVLAATGSFPTTPQTDSIEGRYGNPVATFWAPQTQFTSEDCRIGINKARKFPPVRPGRPYENDLISAVNDHRAPANSASQQTDPLRTSGNEGVPPLWWNADDSDSFNWTKTTSAAGTIPKPRAVYNSPPDLHGRMKTVSVKANGSGVVPRMAFAKAEWSRNDAADVETRDDPYEIRLDTRAPRNSWLNTATALTNPNGNLFNLSELENILRPYDIDSAKLPPRLEAILGSFCEESRLRLTTDSWDTTVITGTAAKYVTDSQRTLWTNVGGDATEFYSKISTANGGRPFTGLMGREIARGERFDLNRPLTSKKPAGGYKATDPYYVQRQAYFQDLYLLLWLLSNNTNGTRGFDHAKCAQWAANVVEYRDADSTMTPFEYDADPSNGWQVDGDASKVDAGVSDRKLVFGTERPEVVITETSAWEDATTGELFVMLHRPWNAKAYATPGQGQPPASLSAEPVDAALDAYKSNDPAQGPLDAVDLGRKSGDTQVNALDPNVYPVWRLRIVAGGQTSYVRLDTTTASGDEQAPTGITAANTPRIGADGWLCLKGTNTLTPPVQIDASANQTTFTSLRVPGTAGAVGVNRDATVYLERLTDPSASVRRGDSTWTADPSADPSTLTNAQLTGMAIYRVVDEAKIQVVNRTPDATGSPPATAIPSRTTRVASGPTAFWKSDFPAAVPESPIRLRPLTPGAAPNDNPVWFHWPNRPLNGSPELLLVHRLDSANLLKSYTKPSMAPAAADDNYLPGLLKTLKNPPLFDAVTIPTRFAGIHGTTSDPSKNLETLAGIDAVTTPVNQLSAYREPGRVNLNTVVADDVWNAVVAGSLAKDKGEPDGPVKTRTDDPASTPPNIGAKLWEKPATSMQALLALSGTAAATAMPVKDTNAALAEAQKYNALHDAYTATRLANTVTNRSHLFGVWITLRECVAPATSTTPGDPDSVRYHRAFYVIDRSIPVAHDPGHDHNVWDAVLLRRIVE